MRTIYDIGMYDGADTAYYLETGHRVVAVEPNPLLVDLARHRFRDAIASGRLTCIHAAITADGADDDLTLSGQDLGSSSLYAERVADRAPIGVVHVPGTTLRELCEAHGRPYYLKVDIEGADRLCVLALTHENRPDYLSFEVGRDVDELVRHAECVGFTRFKLIHQTSFRELANHLCLPDRLAMRVVRTLGFRDPLQVRRAGRYFVSNRSSGPVPWRSDGRWYDADATLERLHDARRGNRLTGWFDIHAASA